MIPAQQARAADIAGRLAAQGRITAADLLPALTEAAHRRAPHLDPAGLRMRIAHAMHDSESAHTAELARVARAVSRSIRAALAARAAKAQVLAAAGDADPERLLPPDQHRTLLHEALSQALRGRV
jgi:hypothetical protein